MYPNNPSKSLSYVYFFPNDIRDHVSLKWYTGDYFSTLSDRFPYENIESWALYVPEIRNEKWTTHSKVHHQEI